MKKKPDVEAVLSELRRDSVFFREPVEQPTIADKPHTVPTSIARRETSTNEEPAVLSVRPVRPVRRKTMRHPFDFYEDQIESLRQLSAEDRMQGGMGSMSEMVREALDRYISERKRGAG